MLPEMDQTCSTGISAGSSEIPEVKTPFSYFERYLKDDFFEDMAEFSNRKYVLLKGRSLNTNGPEIRKYWGASIAAALVGFPKIRMCWDRRTRFPLIADNISRDRFYTLRNSLKIVDDNAVSDLKKEDRFWKVRPMLARVRNACLENPRPKEISIDEQMIPFHGQVRMKQFVRGKPQPVGLKNFVMTTTSGLPLDFLMYEGKGKEIVSGKAPVPEKLDVGGRVVLKLCDSLPAGSSIFIDRYFTSVPVLETLLSHRNIFCTGTIMSNRIPRSVELKRDNEMKREGRGCHDQVVRLDDKMSIVKWYDNRPIYLGSTICGVSPIEECRRWSKKDSAYIQVPRPYIVKMYNTNMGGVDLLDRILSKYAMRNRTKKWTVRVLHHFFDFAVAAAWIEYRYAAQLNKWPSKDILSYFLFKMDIAENLIYYQREREVQQEHEEESDDAEEEDDDVEQAGSKRKRRATQSLPPKAARIQNAIHMPEMMHNQQKSRSRCRFPGCSSVTYIRCTQCKVFLCFTTERNCFRNFHMK